MDRYVLWLFHSTSDRSPKAFVFVPLISRKA